MTTGGRPVVPHRLGPVDPQDLGAHVGQHHAGERTGPDPGQLDDLEPLQRTGQRSLLPSCSVAARRDLDVYWLASPTPTAAT